MVEVNSPPFFVYIQHFLYFYEVITNKELLLEIIRKNQ